MANDWGIGGLEDMVNGTGNMIRRDGGYNFDVFLINKYDSFI
jgi:hypothetical protein